MMIGKTKKHIIYSAEDKVLNIDQKDIEQYLSEVKDAVEKDNYRLDRNARRQDNINLFLDYVIALPDGRHPHHKGLGQSRGRRCGLY